MMLPFQTEAQAFFLSPFTVCSSCRRQFVCLFMKKQIEFIRLTTD